MISLFKKKVSPTEFGQGIIQLAAGWLWNDAGRTLGMRFEDFDGSQGWPYFLRQKGMDDSFIQLYSCVFAHCALQAACSSFGDETAHAVTLGAMKSLARPPSGYSADMTYIEVARVYSGEHRLHSSVANLTNPNFFVPFIPKPEAGILNAKYLLDRFVIGKLDNSEDFITDFNSFSGGVASAIGTATRAIDWHRRSTKLAVL